MSEIDTSAESIARMKDVLTGSLPARVQDDGSVHDPAGFNAVIPGLDALEAWAMIDRLAAENARLREALEPLLRHVSLHAMDELIYEPNGRIGGWRKTPHMMTLTKAARAALGDTP
jgi:hypothetical protein